MKSSTWGPKSGKIRQRLHERGQSSKRNEFAFIGKGKRSLLRTPVKNVELESHIKPADSTSEPQLHIFGNSTLVDTQQIRLEIFIKHPSLSTDSRLGK